MGIKYCDNDKSFTLGLKSLDERFGKPSIRELIIMFGYSGIGKTEFSYFMARQNAIQGNKVHYLSLELPEYDMKQRICLARAGVSKYKFQTNNYTVEQKDIMDNTWDDIESVTNLNIISPLEKDLKTIKQYILKGYSEGCNLFVVDNLDKITLPTTENENTRYQAITSQLQDLKNDLGICIVLIHHAKKAMNQMQASVRAGLEGLRGSQKIVDNSTQIFEVFRDLTIIDENGNMDKKDPSYGITEIHQLKDTFGGPKGYIRIRYEDGIYKDILDNKKKT